MKEINFKPFLLLLLVLFSECSNDDDGDAQINENIIGTNGGTVTSTNNDLTISIPAGALSTSTEITIVETTSHPIGNVGVVYDLGPDGTQFNSPVSLTFSYDPADLPTGRDENDLVIAFAENGSWVPLGSNVVDAGNNTVTALTTHFTPFGLYFPTGNEGEGELPAELFYNPNSYPFVPNQTYETPGANVVGNGALAFSIANVDPDFTSENFTINVENGSVTLSNLTNDASEIKLDITVTNEVGALTTEDALTFNLASLSYTLAKDVFFPGNIFDSGLPESTNIPESYTFFLGDLPAELNGSELTIDDQTGQITGTIGAEVAPGTYALSVTSADANNWSLPFPELIAFEVVAPPTSLSYSPAVTVLTAGETFDSGIPTISGDAPFTFTLGQIDEGLGSTQFNMDAASGQFTGTIANDAVAGMYSFDVNVSNDGGEIVFEDIVSLTLEESAVMLPTIVSYDVSGDFFTYTGAPTAQIDIVEGSNSDLTYTVEVFPSISAGIAIDESGNITINDGLLAANDPGYYTLSVTVSNGMEAATFEQVVIVRAFDPSDPYILDYNPRSSLISAFSPEVLSATSNALFEPPNGPLFAIERVYDQLGDDRTAELIQQEILTIAADGDLTFAISSPSNPVIADNFYSYYVDVRIGEGSSSVVYRAVAVFGPE
ncbi:MAG: hypothetical protein AAF519_12625 [Bacteroidota bacterium]